MNNAVFPVTSLPQFWVIVPTYNPGALAWADWAVALKNQNCKPMQVIVVDSGSTDGSVDISQQAGYTVLHVHAKDFNHGGTRQWALDQGLQNASQLGQPKPDLVVYLTQDAVLVHPNSLQELLSSFFGHSCMFLDSLLLFLFCYFQSKRTNIVCEFNTIHMI